jgi:adenylylsulfate kinase
MDSDSMDSDSHSRSFVKALSWRVFALAITTGVSYALSESVAVAVSIGMVDSAIKIGAYYMHERAWMSVRFGRKQPAPTPRGA